MSGANLTFKNLLVTKLPRDFKDEDLIDVFGPHGCFDAKVMLDATTGLSKRFGFAQFNSEDEGKTAVNNFDDQAFERNGVRLHFRVFPSKHKADITVRPSKCLYVKNVPSAIERQQVFSILCGFGAVEMFSLKPDRHGPFWYITVTYESIDVAERALKGLHNQRLFPDVHVPVLAKYADTEQVRDMRREKEHGGSRSYDEHPSRSYDSMPSGSSPYSGRRGQHRSKGNNASRSNVQQGPPPPHPSAAPTQHPQAMKNVNAMDQHPMEVPFAAATSVEFPKFKRQTIAHHYSAHETGAGMSFDIESSASRSYTPTGPFPPPPGMPDDGTPLNGGRRSSARENSMSLGSTQSNKFRYDPYRQSNVRVDVPLEAEGQN